MDGVTGIPFTLGTECGCGDISPPGASVCDGCGAPFGCKCQHCGDAFALASGHQRFCSDRCRRRENRGAAKPVPRVVETVEPVVAALPRMQQWWKDNHSDEENGRLGGWAA